MLMVRAGMNKLISKYLLKKTVAQVVKKMSTTCTIAIFRRNVRANGDP